MQGEDPNAPSEHVEGRNHHRKYVVDGLRMLMSFRILSDMK
jgi:hypothetical protein